MSPRMKLVSKTNQNVTFLVWKSTIFAWFTYGTVTFLFFKVGSSALDIFQMTFQFVQIRGVFIIRTFYAYDFLYTPSEKLKNPRKNGF